MSYPSTYIRVRRRTEWIRGLALFGIALVVAHLLDYAAYHALVREKEDVEWRGWYQLLKQVGYVPTWLIVTGAMVLAAMPGSAARARALDRAGRIILIVLLSGLFAEIGKLLLGRERPDDGLYVFKPILSAFVDSSNLGFPSSHTSVAFGGCLAIARLFPRTAVLMIALASGCALTRMLSGAHFLSDCVGGAMIAWIFARLVIPRERYP